METQYDRHQTLQHYYKEYFIKVSTGHVWAGLRGAETWIIKSPVLLNLAKNSLGTNWTKQQLFNVALSASPVFSKNNSSASDRSNNRMHQCENNGFFISVRSHTHKQIWLQQSLGGTVSVFYWPRTLFMHSSSHPIQKIPSPINKHFQSATPANVSPVWHQYDTNGTQTSWDWPGSTITL